MALEQEWLAKLHRGKKRTAIMDKAFPRLWALACGPAGSFFSSAPFRLGLVIADRLHMVAALLSCGKGLMITTAR